MSWGSSSKMGDEKIQASTRTPKTGCTMVEGHRPERTRVACSLEAHLCNGWIIGAVWIERFTYGSLRAWGGRSLGLLDSSDSTSRKKLNSTILRISKSSRWWKNSITVRENAWEWKHQIRYSTRIIHLSHFGVEFTLFFWMNIGLLFGYSILSINGGQDQLGYFVGTLLGMVSSLRLILLGRKIRDALQSN